jgi:hypothetical protein
MIGYTAVKKSTDALQVASGTVRYGRKSIGGTFTLWQPGYELVSTKQGEQMRAKRPYHVRWSLKRGMIRPAIWKCPAEITDHVEGLIWQVLDLERPIAD